MNFTKRTYRRAVDRVAAAQDAAEHDFIFNGNDAAEVKFLAMERLGLAIFARERRERGIRRETP